MDVAKAEAAATRAQLGNDPNQPVEQNPSYLQAQSAVDNAERNLDRTIVRAPFDGIVTNVSSLQVGAYLQASQSGFSLVSTTHMWIAASPKETELTYVREGQPVAISVDTYPGVEWKGKVSSISPASGSSFSLLPAQNTTGNWVKVVQRIPMLVSIDDMADKPPLRIGMSVTVGVDTGHAVAVPGAAPVIANRGAITACVILAVIMQALDTTIANVALPYIQGSVSASADQINWVLTSYIVAAAIMTPPSGFLAARFGRKNVLLTAIVGFVVASVLCGLAQSLLQIVIFRLMQGLSALRLFPCLRAFCLTSMQWKSAARPWRFSASQSWSDLFWGQS